MAETTKTFAAPCGWRCETFDDAERPEAVAKAMELLHAAGLTCVLHYRLPLGDEYSADFCDPCVSRDELTVERAQELCRIAAADLCHLSRVQPVEGE